MGIKEVVQSRKADVPDNVVHTPCEESKLLVFSENTRVLEVPSPLEMLSVLYFAPE
jgi:hypothetical protein